MKIQNILLMVVGIAVIWMISASLYKHLHPKVAKSTRIGCFEKVIVFERLYDGELLMDLKRQIASGEFGVDIASQKSHYAQSKLFDYVDPIDVKSQFLRSFGHRVDSKAAQIKALIYENDIMDPRKKTAEALLYAGYIRAGFLYGNQLVYQVQVDFMDKEGRDINQTIGCIKEALETIN